MPYWSFLDDHYIDSANTARSLIQRGMQHPAWFRETLLSVPPADRDAWVNLVFGIVEVVEDDDQELPREGD